MDGVLVAAWLSVFGGYVKNVGDTFNPAAILGTYERGRRGHAVCIIGHVQAMPISIQRHILGCDVLMFSRRMFLSCGVQTKLHHLR